MVLAKPGFVYSPQSGKLVNVEGIAPGTLVQDPTVENGFFRVPQGAAAPTVVAPSAAAPAQAKAGSIVGTWSNSKLTWTFDADGDATLVVPSTNQNGVSTTYMTYTADPDTGVFAYTISRATLTGTLNCDGVSDYDMAVNKSYTEKYQLQGNSLTIGTEVMNRN